VPLTAKQDDGTPDQYDLPPPTTEGAIPPSPTSPRKPGLANGHVHQDESALFVERTGWAPRFGQCSITETEAGESLLDHQTFLESKLDDRFFGGKRCKTAILHESNSLIWPQIGTITRG